MSVDVAKTVNKVLSPHQKAVAALEQAFDATFVLWTREEYAVWVSSSPPAINPSTSDPSLPGLMLLLEETIDTEKPNHIETFPGQHLLAVPLKGLRHDPRCCAVACLTTNSPELLLQLAEAKLQEIQHAKDLASIHEENAFFLKQVSEDFEELAFLRTMAERLVLEDCSSGTDELVAFMLPMLGQTISVEEFYYLDAESGPQPRVDQQWFANAEQASRFSHLQLENLVRHYNDVAQKRPVVKNQIAELGLHSELPDLHEFVLVAVFSAVGPIGWLLGVNKVQPEISTEEEPLWQLGQDEFGTSEASFISTAATMLASYAHNVAFIKERERLLMSVVSTLVSAIESKDNYTCGHSERVARYGKRLAAEVGYDEDACERLYLTGLLHDVGKIGVSDAVLKKEGSLTDEEFAEVQKHPDLGWAILRELEPLSYVLPGVLHHHERVDGKGYPDRLERNEIPYDGQLLAVVDAFDAMTSDRPYRQGMAVEKAVQIFKEGAGTQWNAALVGAFLKILPDILEIKDNYVRPPLPIRSKTNHGLKIIANPNTANL